jgi:hypothetical protein
VSGSDADTGRRIRVPVSQGPRTGLGVALIVRADRWSVRRALAVLFVAIALPTCVTLALLTPLGQVADEPAHVLRAASLLHGQWIGRRGPFVENGKTQIRAGLDVDQAVFGVQNGPERSKATQEDVTRARGQGWAGFLFFYPVPSVAIYMPAFYGPAAAGMGMARLAGAGPFLATYAARLANTACFVALGLAALLLARRGHALLFCTLMLPMTLSLAASVNQDGLIIATSVLAAALLTRSDVPTASGPALPRGAAFWTAGLLLACIAAVKPPYAPLLASPMLPLPPVRDWLALRRPLLLRAAAVVVLLLPGLFWSWLAVATVATPFPKPPYEPGPLWPGPRPALFDETDAAAQLGILLAEPLRFLSIPWTTIIHDPALLHSAVGVLGWLTVVLPGALYTQWYTAVPAALLCDLMARRTGGRQGSLTDLALGIAAAAACVLGIYLSQYLSWTLVGNPTVQGPSGRYLLPILPLLTLSLPVFRVRGGGWLRAGLATVPVAAALAGAAVLPPLVVQAMVLR